MRQTHYVLVGACLVSLAIGYVAGGGDPPATTATDKKGGPANPRAERSSARGDRGARGEGAASEEMLATLLKGRNVQALSSDELTGLIVDLSRYDSSLDPLTRARRNLQLQLLLSKLSPEQLQEAALALTKEPNSRRTGSLGTILGAMAAKSPSGAIEWAKSQENPSSFMGMIIGNMARENPVEAAELYQASLLDGTLGTGSSWEASFGVGSAMARLGGKPFLEFVDSLPRQQQSNILSNSIREVPEGERMALADEIYRRYKEGQIEEWNLKNSLSTLGSGDPAKLAEWMEKVPAGKERAKFMIAQASTLGRMGETRAVGEWMGKAIAEMPGREKELLEELRNSAYNSPSDFANFAKLLPPSVELKAADLKEFANDTIYNGPASAVDMAQALRDPAEQADLISGVLDTLRQQKEERSGPSRVNTADFAILKSRLKNLNLTGDDAARVNAALDAAMNATPKPKE